MPITSSAKRAIRVSERKRVFNIRRVTTMREAVKDTRKMVKEGDAAALKTQLSVAYQAIDKAAKRGVIKKNTAARKKSRLAKFIAKKQTPVAKKK